MQTNPMLVPASTTLRELHGILQVAMGWKGVHLFLFNVNAVRYGSFELHVANPDVPLQDFGYRGKERFSYIYDMGDHWEHEIRIEAVNPQPKKSYLTCIGGSGTCPPEDCGGPHGYLERRDETESYDAWRDLHIMIGFFEGVVATDAPDRQVSDFLTADVEAASSEGLFVEPR